MSRTGRTQKEMAHAAGQKESALSDALNGNGRNLEVDWLLSQGADYVAEFIADVQIRMGLTVESKRDLKAARISELIRLLLEVA